MFFIPQTSCRNKVVYHTPFLSLFPLCYDEQTMSTFYSNSACVCSSESDFLFLSLACFGSNEESKKAAKKRNKKVAYKNVICRSTVIVQITFQPLSFHHHHRLPFISFAIPSVGKAAARMIAAAQ